MKYELTKKPLLHQGFSLVELLTVIMLIGILSAIGVARFNFIKDHSKSSEVKAGLANFYQLQNTYYIENGFYTNKIEEIGFKFNSKNYVVGFQGVFGINYTGADPQNWKNKPRNNRGDNRPIQGGCNTYCQAGRGDDRCGKLAVTFQAGSANDDNELPNYMINEDNCFIQLRKKTANCWCGEDTHEGYEKCKEDLEKCRNQI